MYLYNSLNNNKKRETLKVSLNKSFLKNYIKAHKPSLPKT